MDQTDPIGNELSDSSSEAITIESKSEKDDIYSAWCTPGSALSVPEANPIYEGHFQSLLIQNGEESPCSFSQSFSVDHYQNVIEYRNKNSVQCVRGNSVSAVPCCGKLSICQIL